MRTFQLANLEQRMFGLQQLERLVDVVQKLAKSKTPVTTKKSLITTTTTTTTKAMTTSRTPTTQALFAPVSEEGEVSESTIPPPPPPLPLLSNQEEQQSTPSLPEEEEQSTTLSLPSSHFSPSVLNDWLREGDFFRLLMDISPMHTEILSRSKRILKFMAMEGGLTLSHFLRVWNLIHNQHHP